VASRSLQAFSRQEVELLSNLANQVAIAIENARLYEQVQTSATLDERERIAREMHDSLAQTLGVLHLKVSRAQQLLGSDQPSRVEAALEEIRKLTEDAYDDVRQAIYGLRTFVSRRLGLVPTLTEYLHEWSVQSGIAVDLQIHSEEATRLPPEAEVQLIRIIQEALTNVRKHTGAEHAWVSFSLEEGLAVVTIADDGKGFALAELQKQSRKGFGLETMRERAESVGGSLEITSQLGKGTQVVARLPLQGERRL
jgi:signal transduction histidine kinase